MDKSRSWSRPDKETLQVLAITGVVWVIAAGLGYRFLGEGLLAGHPSIWLPWWFLALGFAATEAVVMNVQVRREAQTVSVSELPLVLGLFFATPGALLLGRLVGSLSIFVLHRRSPALKSFFNAALVCAETAVAITVFRLLSTEVFAAGPREWLAALVAALVANAVSSMVLSLVIGVYEEHLGIFELLRVAVTGQAAAPLVVTIALVAVNSLAEDPRNAWLLVAAGGVLLLGYRAYAGLADRHLNLERLYHFSQVVTISPETDEIMRRVLEEAQELLSSDHAEMVFPGAAAGTTPVRVVHDRREGITRVEDHADAADDWLLRSVMEDAASTVLARGSRDARLRGWLDGRELRDAIAVPLRGGAGTIGMLLVGDRLGEVRTFDDGDLLLLETLANHASIALQKGELIDQLQHDALHDPLTRLPNRSHLQLNLEEALADVRSGESPGMAVLIADLNGFKDVNDTLGHLQGDIVLVEVARRLAIAVGKQGFVARLGGDEFAVVVPVAGDTEVAVAIGRRLLAALEEPIELPEMQVGVGASIGISFGPQHGSEPFHLLKHADMAMYDAKSSGQDLSIYEPQIDKTSARRLSMVGELRTAIQQGGITVHVQPQVDAITGAVRSVEALARWQHPRWGSVPPDEFIPVAERSGLINPLTLSVLDASLAATAAWQELGVGVAVNLSARTLRDSGLVADVESLLARHGTSAPSLTFEVTESAVMVDPHRAISMLEQLSARGVRLSLDDFGTGYSSLSYLKRLPVQEVKIDRSFVIGLTRGSEDFAIVRSIVDLGTNLGLDIVAEGVETQEAWDLLQEMGCTILQGWHIGRPMPVDRATDWLHQRARIRQPEGSERGRLTSYWDAGEAALSSPVF